MKIPKLIQEYQDFIVVADEAMRINPQLSDIVVVTNEKVAEELSHCYKSLAHIGLISSAILKASPDEKVNAAMKVADALGNTRNIIAKAKYKCRGNVGVACEKTDRRSEYYKANKVGCRKRNYGIVDCHKKTIR